MSISAEFTALGIREIVYESHSRHGDGRRPDRLVRGDRNVETITGYVATAKAEGAELVVFPEYAMFTARQSR